MDFAGEINWLMQRHNLTLGDLARLSGMSKTTLCESLARDMRGTTINTIFDALGYDLIITPKK